MALHCGDVIGTRHGVEEIVRSVVRYPGQGMVQVGTRAGELYYGYLVVNDVLQLNWGPIARGDPNVAR